ncbi:hypothetical protein ABFX02_10G149100 [Erythranthe guttata]
MAYNNPSARYALALTAAFLFATATLNPRPSGHSSAHPPHWRLTLLHRHRKLPRRPTHSGGYHKCHLQYSSPRWWFTGDRQRHDQCERNSAGQLCGVPVAQHHRNSCFGSFV